MSYENSPYEKPAAPTTAAVTGWFIPSQNDQSHVNEAAVDKSAPRGAFVDGTRVLATIEEMALDTNERDGLHIAVRAKVVKPEVSQGHLLFFKLKTFGNVPANASDDERAKIGRAATRAQKMLMAVQSFAQTNAVSQALARGSIDNAALSTLHGTPVGLTLGLWEIKTEEGGTMNGNWVRSIHSPALIEVTESPRMVEPVEAPTYNAPAGQGLQRVQSGGAAMTFADDDGGIPF